MKIRGPGASVTRLAVLRTVAGNPAMVLLLALCIARLWWMPLSSSFWVDEMVTVFVVRHGTGHPSLAVAPQVPASIYYHLPRAAEALLGFSEVSYRLPSVLMMAVALFLVARLAARLIHPQAGWFAVFACLALHGINYEAADARPYALGSCVAGASLWFLIRWLDSAHWRDALLFVVFAGLLWRVHLVFWPFYLVIAACTLVRLARRDTRVGWLRAGVVFALLGMALLPVFFQALALLRDAQAHVIVPPPSLRALAHSLEWRLVIACGAGAWLLRRLFRWSPAPAPPSWASRTLVLGWWLCHPLCLFGFSWLTGNSVFVPRYLSLALPGAALAATALAARSIPSTHWRPLAALLGAGVLLALGQWRNPWPLHHNSDWRTAAHRIRELPLAAGTPVICPSPFIEARPPVWRPDYPVPGFLYAHLSVYSIRGKACFFPFETSREAEQYAARLSQEALRDSGRFVLYGGDSNVLLWRGWFARRPELAGWRSSRLGPFGDVEVVVFEK